MFGLQVGEFVCHLLFQGFAPADELVSAAVNQHFRRTVARVVIARHAGTVCARAADKQQITFFAGDGAVFAEEVAGFTNRADDVGRQRLNVFGFDRLDVMIGII